MSIGTWHVNFVHPDESYQAPTELYENAKRLLEQIAWLGTEFQEQDGSWASFNPKEVDLPINARDGGRAGYVEFDYRVQRFDKPMPEEQHGVKRHCKACGALVVTRAVCSQCGEEEDPAEWNIGPPVNLYTRSFEIGFTFSGGPDLCVESDVVIETKLREQLKGILDELEGAVGTRFVMKKYSGE